MNEQGCEVKLLLPLLTDIFSDAKGTTARNK